MSNNKLNIPIAEFTSPSVVTATMDASFEEMKNLMKKGGFRHLPIIDQNRNPVGIVSQRDLNLLETLGSLVGQVSAKDIMKKDPYLVQATDSMEKVVLEMSSRKIGSALVRDPEDGDLGIFTSTDALNALVEILRGEA